MSRSKQQKVTDPSHEEKGGVERCGIRNKVVNTQQVTVTAGVRDNRDARKEPGQGRGATGSASLLPSQNSADCMPLKMTTEGREAEGG